MTSVPRIIIEFYHSRFCPRCALVARELRSLQARYPELQVEGIEVVSNFRRTRAAGVRWVPTLRIGNKSLSGILLLPAAVRRFVSSSLGRE